jgi:hypothetical protein
MSTMEHGSSTHIEALSSHPHNMGKNRTNVYIRLGLDHDYWHSEPNEPYDFLSLLHNHMPMFNQCHIFSPPRNACWQLLALGWGACMILVTFYFQVWNYLMCILNLHISHSCASLDNLCIVSKQGKMQAKLSDISTHHITTHIYILHCQRGCCF